MSIEIKKCIVCGNDYLPKLSVQKYCSRKCKAIEEGKKRSKKTGVKKCKQCEKTFEPYTSLDKFCSANCRIENQKSKRSFQWSPEKTQNIMGEKNPAYRNGNYVRGRKKITEGERIFIRNSKELKQKMIDKKGFVYCEFCQTSWSPRFESHHIIFRSEKPLHKHLHDKINILIVCIGCHNMLHKCKGLRDKITEIRKLNELFGNDVLDKRISH